MKAAKKRANSADRADPRAPRAGRMKMPLPFEEALAALIEVKPEPKPPNGKPKPKSAK